MSAKPLTNAEAARVIASITRTAALASVHLAEGMGNPHFCAADCSNWAFSVVEDLRARIDHLERRATEGSQP